MNFYALLFFHFFRFPLIFFSVFHFVSVDMCSPFLFSIIRSSLFVSFYYLIPLCLLIFLTFSGISHFFSNYLLIIIFGILLIPFTTRDSPLHFFNYFPGSIFNFLDFHFFCNVPFPPFALINFCTLLFNYSRFLIHRYYLLIFFCTVSFFFF